MKFQGKVNRKNLIKQDKRKQKKERQVTYITNIFQERQKQKCTLKNTYECSDVKKCWQRKKSGSYVKDKLVILKTRMNRRPRIK